MITPPSYLSLVYGTLRIGGNSCDILLFFNLLIRLGFVYELDSFTAQFAQLALLLLVSLRRHFERDPAHFSPLPPKRAYPAALQANLSWDIALQGIPDRRTRIFLFDNTSILCEPSRVSQLHDFIIILFKNQHIFRAEKGNSSRTV
jgi:hypothetical protein